MTLPVRVFLLCIVSLITASGCTVKTAHPGAVFMPERIIRDFSDMREHEIVSWSWVRRGFALNSCSRIIIDPVINAGQISKPSVVGRLEQALHTALQNRTGESGELTVNVQAAVLDLRVEPGFITKWFTEFDNFPYIEVEILIQDSETGMPLVKIAHFRRDQKSLDTAVSNLINDLVLFFTTAI